MDNEEIFRHYSAILDNLLREDYWRYYFQYPFRREYGDWLDDDCSLMITNGYSRGCIIDNNCEWVVKFNLPHSYQGNACDCEVSFYKDAKKNCLANCFVECNFIGVYRKKIHYFRADDLYALYPSLDYCEWIDEAATKFNMEDIVIEVPLYAYRRAEESSIPWSLNKEDCVLGDSIHSPIAEAHVEVAVALWKNWGEQVFNRFDAFCRTHGIDDLHSGNIGEIDGHLVVLDYAGYN